MSLKGFSMFKTLSVFFSLFIFWGQAHSGDIYITIGSEVTQNVPKSLKSFALSEEQGNIALVRISEDDTELLSQHMHENYLRCGGFIVHESLEEAQQVVRESSKRLFAQKFSLNQYQIDQKVLVKSAIEQVDEFRIRSVIESLSSFRNRHYKSQTGVESQAWLKEHWKKLTQNRQDINVADFTHSQWPQPSVIMTIKGSESPDDIIIIGGHADSIAGWFGQGSSHAPGADDNASGIATITELARVVVDQSYRPKKTVMLMAYAAEEVGLKGSKEIARTFKAQSKNVVGVLQLDMTNFKGSSDDIVLISDYTSERQNEFLAQLIDEYVKVPWGRSRCGYACSDHASWTNEGFAASMPFEAHKSEMNRYIHTKKDTLELSQGHAEHATHFAKLALAYMIELAK